MHSVTVIAHKHLGVEVPDKVTDLLANLGVSIVETHILSARRVLDYTVNLDSSSASYEEIRSKIRAAHFEECDLIFQECGPSRKDKKLFVFDMDSTLIYQEVIEMIAKYADVEDKVAEITTAAMNGEIEFSESLARRVMLLKGIDGTIWEDLKKQIQITNGARELCKGLKKTGCKMAVCSGGFIPLAKYVAEQLGLDYAFANKLETEIVNGKEVFSGKTVGEVVNGEKKEQLLRRLAEENNVPLENTVAVGDGANDLKMMATAGWGVAWHAKPKVQQAAQSCLNTDSLLDIFYILGYTESEIENLLA